MRTKKKNYRVKMNSTKDSKRVKLKKSTDFRSLGFSNSASSSSVSLPEKVNLQKERTISSKGTASSDVSACKITEPSSNESNLVTQPKVSSSTCESLSGNNTPVKKKGPSYVSPETVAKPESFIPPYETQEITIIESSRREEKYELIDISDEGDEKFSSNGSKAPVPLATTAKRKEVDSSIEKDSGFGLKLCKTFEDQWVGSKSALAKGQLHTHVPQENFESKKMKIMSPTCTVSLKTKPEPLKFDLYNNFMSSQVETSSVSYQASVVNSSMQETSCRLQYKAAEDQLVGDKSTYAQKPLDTKVTQEKNEVKILKSPTSRKTVLELSKPDLSDDLRSSQIGNKYVSQQSVVNSSAQETSCGPLCKSVDIIGEKSTHIKRPLDILQTIDMVQKTCVQVAKGKNGLNESNQLEALHDGKSMKLTCESSSSGRRSKTSGNSPSGKMHNTSTSRIVRPPEPFPTPILNYLHVNRRLFSSEISKLHRWLKFLKISKSNRQIYESVKVGDRGIP